MERTTKFSNDIIRNNAITVLRKLNDKNGLSEDELAVISAFCLIERVENKKLKEYEDLEERGLLPKLPCKVGDTVYVIEASEEEFEHFHCGLRISKCEFDFWMIPLFGKCVFLTQAEAEDALKRMKKED